MRYVDGYLVPVPKKSLKAYLRLARLGAKLWKKHGALEYKECIGDDLKPKWGLPFPKAVRVKPGETVVFSFVVFKSRAQRDRVNAAVMKEMQTQCPTLEMPFDCKRMVYGGFEAVVDA